MRSWLRFAIAVGLLLALTLAPKIGRHDDGGASPEAMGTDRLQAFLLGSGAQALTTVRQRPDMPDYAGWAFTVQGCRGLTFPVPRDADLGPAAELHVRPGERLVYVDRGVLADKPERVRYILDRVIFRLEGAVRGAAPPPRGEVILIFSPACDAPARLNWKAY